METEQEKPSRPDKEAEMVAIPAQHHRIRRLHRGGEGAGRAHTRSGIGRYGPRRLLRALVPALKAMLDARGLVPEPEPQQLRAMLIEIGVLDAAAPPPEHRRALASFQRANGLADDGVADGRTVSMLSRSWRESRANRGAAL